MANQETTPTTDTEFTYYFGADGDECDVRFSYQLKKSDLTSLVNLFIRFLRGLGFTDDQVYTVLDDTCARYEDAA